MSDDSGNDSREGADGSSAQAAGDSTREEMQAQLQRHIEAASQLQSIKSQTLGSRTFKARNVDPSMRPTLQPGDILEIGGASLMKLKPNDLVYYRVSGDEFRVRKIVRRRNDLSDVAFIVADELGHEESIIDAQVFGMVVAYERNGQSVRLQRPPMNIDTSDLMEQGRELGLKAWNRISDLFKRKSGG